MKAALAAAVGLACAMALALGRHVPAPPPPPATATREAAPVAAARTAGARVAATPEPPRLVPVPACAPQVFAVAREEFAPDVAFDQALWSAWTRARTELPDDGHLRERLARDGYRVLADGPRPSDGWVVMATRERVGYLRAGSSGEVTMVAARPPAEGPDDGWCWCEGPFPGPHRLRDWSPDTPRRGQVAFAGSELVFAGAGGAAEERDLARDWPDVAAVTVLLQPDGDSPRRAVPVAELAGPGCAAQLRVRERGPPFGVYRIEGRRSRFAPRPLHTALVDLRPRSAR